MRCVRRMLVMMAALVPLLVQADTPTDELDHNRRLLEKWKTDPEHYARLRHDLRVFLALPPERQDQLRRLDRQLHEQDSGTQARLRRVLERYADWLQRLPPAEREAIERAEPAQRLRLLRQRREQEWLERLPRAIREELEKLRPKPAEYQARLTALRQEERQRQSQWRYAIRHWDQLNQRSQQLARLRQFQPEIEDFVRTSLLPVLSPEEKLRLQQAREALKAKQEATPYLSTVAELADKHPLKLPGPIGPTRFKELPADVQRALAVVRNPPEKLAVPLQRAEGKWPDYAVAVTLFANRHHITLPRQLGPSRPAEFSPAVREFLDKELRPRLSADEKQRLLSAEGRWPRYPRVLLNLARKYRLDVPGMTLPGPRDLWAPFRPKQVARVEAFPEVPDQTLREFLRKDLTDAERAILPSFSLSDPTSREQLKRAYFQRHPRELERLRQIDQLHEGRDPAPGRTK